MQRIVSQKTRRMRRPAALAPEYARGSAIRFLKRKMKRAFKRIETTVYSYV